MAGAVLAIAIACAGLIAKPGGVCVRLPTANNGAATSGGGPAAAAAAAGAAAKATMIKDRSSRKVRRMS